MVRVTDYDTRRKEVLRAVIELYLETARPVSSEALLERYGFDVSSATIRNVFQDLETKGLLTHLHTSAGRIPTDKGYRFYIDDLMDNIELSKDEKKILEQFFSLNLRRGQDVFESASQLLSHFTHYVGLVNHQEQNTLYYCGLRYLFEQPEFKEIDAVHPIFRAIEEDDLLQVMHRRFQQPIEVVIGKENGCKAVQSCSMIVCECEDSEGDIATLALLGPKRMAYKRVIPMMDYVAALVVQEF